jgi:signal transduction histidine kinase
VPLFAPPVDALQELPDVLGVLSLYGDSDRGAESAAEASVALAPVVTRLYLAAVERTSALLQRRLTRVAGFRRDIASLVHSYLTLVAAALSVEAAAVWIFDARRNVLYRRLAIGAESGDEPTLRPGDASSIARCFREGVELRLDSQTRDEYAISPVTGTRTWNAFPILLPPGARIHGRQLAAAGVVEFANHYVDGDQRRNYAPPSWENQFLARASVDTLALLLYQMLRTRDHESDYERVMHGAKTSLQAARANLQGLAAVVHIEDLPTHSRFYLPHALAWIDELTQRLSKRDLMRFDPLLLEPVELDEVLARLPQLVESLNVRSSRAPLELRWAQGCIPSDSGVMVQANAQALGSVLRDLIENSERYCRPVSGHAPVLTVEVVCSAEELVAILLSDNGPAIPEADADHIFEAGFRGDMAMARQPQGTGQGLYDCRTLMERMGGHIALLRDREDVAFKLTLRRVGARSSSEMA